MAKKPDGDQIVADARKLKDDRFSQRDSKLKSRAAERFNETTVDVPAAYKKTSHDPKSSIIEDEGQQIGTLVYAMPVPHIPAAVPEDEPLVDKEEAFLMAWHQEAEAHFGPVWWQSTLAQIHDNISWVYCGWRKVPYKGQPEPPKDEADLVGLADFMVKNDRYKQEQGVKSYCDVRYAPTGTIYWSGNVFDPDRVCEIKEVPERTMLDKYGVVKDSQGNYSKPTSEETTTPSGYPQDHGGTETMVKVVEYWDRDWCMIVAETSAKTWMFGKEVKGGFVLDEWEHNWGRVPYFARPARITDQIDEDKKFAGPLDALYVEMPHFKKLDAMSYSVAYQTAFSPLQIKTAKEGDQVLDDSGKPLAFLELEPGKARQMAPGQEIDVIPQSPEVANLFAEKAAAQARLEHFSLSPVAKGVSPGADTANAALSNLHRFQLSTLDPLAQQASRQASAMYRFILERIREGGERVFVFDRSTDQYLSLDASEVVSINVQAHVTPDQGQFQLLIEKHALELWMSGAITEIEFHEMRGKENPDKFVEANTVERLRKTLDPIILNQVVNKLGMMDAINAMMAAHAQTGDAANAIPGLQQQAQGLDTANGMGQGSPGQPRDNGVRAPVVSETTQPGLSSGGP